MCRVILVTGAERSGIAMTGHALARCAGQAGKVNDWNKQIHDELVHPLLHGIGAHIAGQDPLPDTARCQELAPVVAAVWRRKVLDMALGGRLFYVSPLACLIWPIWHAAFPSARWVLARREDGDIIESCMDTGWMNEFTRPHEWHKWLEAHKRKFAEMIDAGLTIWQTWPSLIFEGRLSGLKAVVDWLGLEWDRSQVEDHVAAAMWEAGVFEFQGENHGKSD